MITVVQRCAMIYVNDYILLVLNALHFCEAHQKFIFNFFNFFKIIIIENHENHNDAICCVMYERTKEKREK